MDINRRKQVVQLIASASCVQIPFNRARTFLPLLPDLQTPTSESQTVIGWRLSGFGIVGSKSGKQLPEKRGNRLAQFWAQEAPSDENKGALRSTNSLFPTLFLLHTIFTIHHVPGGYIQYSF